MKNFLKTGTSVNLSRVLVVLFLSGCAAAPKKAEGPGSIDELRTQLTQLTAKVDAMEGTLNAVNDKADGTKANLEIYLSRAGLAPPPSEPSSPTANATHGTSAKLGGAEHFGAPVAVVKSSGDSEGGFDRNDASESYRKAMMLFQTSKFSDASLAFSNFVERYPDHPFAGGAQYYAGASYLKQGEFKLALQEYQKVVTSFDRSPRISFALRDMAVAYEGMNQPDSLREATQKRQLLASLFASSPAAHGMDQEIAPAIKKSKGIAPATDAPTSITASPKAGMGYDAPPLTAPNGDSE